MAVKPHHIEEALSHALHDSVVALRHTQQHGVKQYAAAMDDERHAVRRICLRVDGVHISGKPLQQDAAETRAALPAFIPSHGHTCLGFPALRTNASD